MNDREKARKLREKGWSGPSASDKAKAKSNRSGSRSEPVSGDVVDALRNFDSSRPRETAVPRSEGSKQRARSFKRGLPRLG